MANPQKGEVPLEIDGRHYTLVLNTNAIASLEAVLSRADRAPVVLSEVLFDMARGSQTYTRAFLWACLRQHHKEITIDQVGNLIDAAGGGEALFGQLAALKRSAVPDPEDAALARKPDPDRPRRPRQRRGTGAGVTSTPGASG